MTQITPCFYAELARIISLKVKNSNYLNESITLQMGIVEVTCKFSCIVERLLQNELPKDVQNSNILIRKHAAESCQITPVWWECITVSHGEVTPNDFSWRDFNLFLMRVLRKLNPSGKSVQSDCSQESCSHLRRFDPTLVSSSC